MLLAPDADKLTNPVHTPYVLARSNNGTDFVGGVYMRLFKNRQAVVDSFKADAETGKKEDQIGFMKELSALIAKRFFASK